MHANKRTGYDKTVRNPRPRASKTEEPDFCAKRDHRARSVEEKELVAVLEMSRSAPACNLFSLPGDSTMNAQYALTHFVNDDDGYLRWLAQNPDGFVVNSNRVPVSSYLILHRASCT